MDLKIVKDLLALMQEGELTELHVVQGETEIRLSRQPEVGPAPVVYAAAPNAVAPLAPAAPITKEPQGELFRSPMVGTYYSKPDPDSPSYVAVGDSVGGETVLCIIEAMKVFNEIQAEFSGTILAILVKDGEAVEYDQPLFRIQTS
ncbi:MAG: acetyl-CoA carboxylase biotin carboxyl carrier protein [Planctomycetota bacterium]|nr:acetyl-CoA carboxylase biotin carboxyl carrier protein [Planctomycetota bacterium]MDA1114742.1 acetyl-CoA carboxylase biotin carboxyl carrier protein [Planctomycetota bacterium]